MAIMYLGAALAAAVLALLVTLYHRERPYVALRVPRKPNYAAVDLRKALPPKTGLQYTVTGGGGFMGQYMVEHLLLRGETRVRVLDIVPPSRFASDARVQFVKTDITDAEAVRRTIAGSDVVYHIAAYLSYTERLDYQYARSHKINVLGTENVVNACVAENVPTLVHVSTSNVVVGRDSCRLDMDETDPFPEPMNHYIRSKQLAEKAALSGNGRKLASGKGTLSVVAIRPTSAIFGHGDRFCMDAAVKNKFTLLSGNTTLDHTYVENVVYGLQLAERKLLDKAPHVAGEAFFVSNDNPLRYDDLVHAMKTQMPDLKPVAMPRPMSWVIGHVVELIQRVTRGRVNLGELGSLSVATWLVAGSTYTMRIDKAKRYLGYAPLYTVEEGIEKSLALAKYQPKKTA